MTLHLKYLELQPFIFTARKLWPAGGYCILLYWHTYSFFIHVLFFKVIQNSKQIGLGGKSPKDNILAQKMPLEPFLASF